MMAGAGGVAAIAALGVSGWALRQTPKGASNSDPHAVDDGQSLAPDTQSLLHVASALTGGPVLRVTRQGAILEAVGCQPAGLRDGALLAEINVGDRPATLMTLACARGDASEIKVRLREGVLGQGGETWLRMVSLADDVLVSLQPVPSHGAQTPFDISACAHDMRSPLAAIASLADHMAARATDRESVGAASRMIATAARDALAMTDHLLARGNQAHRLPVRPAPLGDIVDTVLANQDEARRAAGAMFFMRVPAGLADVTLDRDSAVRVLDNLIGNALKHGGERVSIEISARIDGPMVEITVRDNGCGMSPVIRARLESAPGQPVSSDGGHGLGLASVARLLEAEGGRLAVLPTPGGGTSVTVSLRRVPRAPHLLDENRPDGIAGERDAPLRRLA